MRILVVDDEQELCEILQYNLETEGYEVEIALSAEDALGKNLVSFDLLLLDVMMGEMSGFELANELKKTPTTAHIPIIFITALDEEEYIVSGLNLGADDYIAKPLSMREVKARVKAVLRRSSPIEDENRDDCIVFDALSINLIKKTATLHSEPLHLTRLEFELLSLLLQHPGRLYDRDSLLHLCWPKDTVVGDRTVDVNIARLRRKIGEYGKQIKSRIGYGYTFDDK